MSIGGSIEVRTVGEARELAAIVVASGMVACRRPEEAVVILLTGRELGLSPMQALRGIHVVNGRPVLSADLMVAVVRRSGVCAGWRTVRSTAEECVIETTRVGEDHPATKTWTLADARRAGVTGKPIWSQYPAQMLRHRCAADLAREVYPDVLLGLYDPEELTDIEAPQRVSVQVAPAPAAALLASDEGSSTPSPSPEPEVRLAGIEAPGRSLVDDLVAELSSRPSVTAIAESWQVARSDVAQWAESDRTRVWKAAVARAVALGSTQTALRAEIARLSTPPPDGTSGPARGPAERSTESAPSEASGGAGEATAAQASAWAASLDQTRDHVAAIAHMRHLEASVRSHGSHLTPAQIEIYAARAEALSPPDLYGARETPASLLRRCERWAREGAVAATPAQRRRAA